LAKQEAIRRRPPRTRACEETGRVHADAEKALASFHTEAAAELAAVRADLRTRAVRAEAQADAYRGGLARLHEGTRRDDSAPTRVPQRAQRGGDTFTPLATRGHGPTRAGRPYFYAAALAG
jgi:uncharacterized membrane protein YccC